MPQDPFVVVRSTTYSEDLSQTDHAVKRIRESHTDHSERVHRLISNHPYVSPVVSGAQARQRLDLYCKYFLLSEAVRLFDRRGLLAAVQTSFVGKTHPQARVIVTRINKIVKLQEQRPWWLLLFLAVEDEHSDHHLDAYAGTIEQQEDGRLDENTIARYAAYMRSYFVAYLGRQKLGVEEVSLSPPEVRIVDELLECSTGSILTTQLRGVVDAVGSRIHGVPASQHARMELYVTWQPFRLQHTRAANLAVLIVYLGNDVPLDLFGYALSSKTVWNDQGERETWSLQDHRIFVGHLVDRGSLEDDLAVLSRAGIVTVASRVCSVHERYRDVIEGFTDQNVWARRTVYILWHVFPVDQHLDVSFGDRGRLLLSLMPGVVNMLDDVVRDHLPALTTRDKLRAVQVLLSISYFRDDVDFKLRAVAVARRCLSGESAAAASRMRVDLDLRTRTLGRLWQRPATVHAPGSEPGDYRQKCESTVELAQTLMMHNQLEQARDLLRQPPCPEPPSSSRERAALAMHRLAFGKALQWSGSFTEAESIFHSLLQDEGRLAPHTVCFVWSHLADSMCEQGRANDALVLLDDAFRRLDEDRTTTLGRSRLLHASRADAYRALARYDEAIGEYERLLVYIAAPPQRARVQQNHVQTTMLSLRVCLGLAITYTALHYHRQADEHLRRAQRITDALMGGYCFVSVVIKTLIAQNSKRPGDEHVRLEARWRWEQNGSRVEHWFPGLGTKVGPQVLSIAATSAM